MYVNGSVSVTIGDKSLQTIASIAANDDSATIGSNCDIIVPLNCRIQYQNGKKDFLTDYPKNLFKVGDKVNVVARYEGYPDITVFNGYVLDFKDGTPVKIQCVDNIYLLNQSTVSIAYKSITLKNLITRVLQGTGITLDLPVMEMTLENISFRLMSPAAILEWFKKELGINISLSGTGLYVNLASNTLDTVKLRSDRNVWGCGLQKPDSVFTRYKVKAWFFRQDGTKDSIEVGDSDGHLREVFFYKIPRNEATYKQLANEALYQVRQRVYNGTLDTFLYPVAKLFDRLEYTDIRYPDRSGVYVCVGREFSADENGFHWKYKAAHLSQLNIAN